MNVLFVTSFSEAGRKQYGMDMLHSWAAKSDFDIAVFLEDSKVEDCVIAENITYYELEPLILSMHDFEMYRIINNAITSGRQDIVRQLTTDYRWQGNKFARKVYAVTDERLRVNKDWLIWIDADTVVNKVLQDNFINEVLDPAEDCCCVYLGRKNWHHSECGFVAYNLNAGGARFLDEFENMYTSFDYLTLDEWHDSYVFDVVRKSMEEEGYKFYDLSMGKDLGSPKKNGNSALHIWPHTVLGKYLEHNKGALKNK